MDGLPGQDGPDQQVHVGQGNPCVYFEIRIDDRPVGQITFELRRDLAAKTCENFLKLCSGECGLSETSKFELTYKGCKFHRILPNQVCQSGDFTSKDGTGGESIYGPEGFEDETFSLSHVGPGVLSMVNSGPDSNRSQFFITFSKMPSLDRSHVVFGYVIEGLPVLRMIEACGTPSGRPTRTVTIADCGVISES